MHLSKERLAQLPQAERTLLFLLGHTSNEICVLHKLILGMLQGDHTPHEHRMIQIGQMLIVLRLLIGKLHEGWDLYRKRVQSSRAMHSAYVADLPERAQVSLGRLKEHFKRRSALTEIRHKLSFHNADKDELVERHFHSLSDSISPTTWRTRFITHRNSS